MLIFIKLGGSLITDKNVEKTFRRAIAERLAQEITDALHADSQLKLLIGHGSGSFGHFAAKRYQTMQGVQTTEQWRGYAEVAHAAATLNYLVTETLIQMRLPVWRIQPSAIARCDNGVIHKIDTFAIDTALKRGLIPVVYGDVALDEVLGGTIISTETIFTALAKHMPVSQILLLGEVDGVMDTEGKAIEEISNDTLANVKSALGRSAGVDVTGGMFSKVHDMLALTESVPALEIRIMDGTVPGLLRDTLLQKANPGTLIKSL
jgi:isopentenyl phosphate kinase